MNTASTSSTTPQTAEAVKTVEAALIEKAGGIIVRKNANGQTELLLIHRPHYDDWSVPKGHKNPGETRMQAAIRETGEETGMHVAITRELPPYFYALPSGEHSVVYFFQMTIVQEGYRTDTEVDTTAWKTISEAIASVSYPSLQQYLKDVEEVLST